MNGIRSVGGRGMTIGGPTNLFPAIPFDIRRSGNYRKDIDVMTGVTRHDGSAVVASLYLDMRYELSSLEKIPKSCLMNFCSSIVRHISKHW